MVTGWTGEKYRHSAARKGIKTVNTYNRNKMYSRGYDDNIYAQAEDNKYRLSIVYDTDPQNPRTEWDNLGKMVCWHNRYNLGDEQPRQNPDEYLEELAIELDPSIESRIEYWRNGIGFDKLCKQFGTDFNKKSNAFYKSEEKIQDIINEVIDKKTVMLPLYLYDHSGITMSTGSFGDMWDSGKVGFIYMTNDEIKKEYGKVSPKTKEQARKYLKGEVETYDDYLTGNVYGYRIEQKINGDWEEIDSCYGFYGDNAKENLKDYIPKDAMNVYNKL